MLTLFSTRTLFCMSKWRRIYKMRVSREVSRLADENHERESDFTARVYHQTRSSSRDFMAVRYLWLSDYSLWEEHSAGGRVASRKSSRCSVVVSVPFPRLCPVECTRDCALARQVTRLENCAFRPNKLREHSRALLSHSPRIKGSKLHVSKDVAGLCVARAETTSALSFYGWCFRTPYSFRSRIALRITNAYRVRSASNRVPLPLNQCFTKQSSRWWYAIVYVALVFRFRFEIS